MVELKFSSDCGRLLLQAADTEDLIQLTEMLTSSSYLNSSGSCANVAISNCAYSKDDASNGADVKRNNERSNTALHQQHLSSVLSKYTYSSIEYAWMKDKKSNAFTDEDRRYGKQENCTMELLIQSTPGW